MVGQNNIKKYIRSFSINSFPSVMLIVGDVGSGRRTLINEEIVELLGLEVKDITNSISYEEIGEIYLSPISYIYMIDLDSCSIKKQNMLLKFLEESPIGSKTILLSSNESAIINTIVNRCAVIRFEPYSDEELLNFCDDKDIIRVVRTPGKLLDKNLVVNIGSIKDLAKNMLLKSKSATFSNLLSVSSKISFDKNDTTKVDIKTFNNIIIFEASELFKERLIDSVLYQIVRDYVNSHDFTLSKFDRFLTELKFYEH